MAERRNECRHGARQRYSRGEWFLSTFSDERGRALYFSANDGVNGYELWQSDGTSVGTLLVKDVRTGSGGSYPRYLTNVNGKLYFQANDGVNGDELWKSDGTSGGTVLVKDLRAGSAGSGLSKLTNLGGMLLFNANDGVNGQELWQSDGTFTGTLLVKDILTGSGGSNPSLLTAVGDKLFFAATTDPFGQEIYVIGGTVTATTVELSSTGGLIFDIDSALFGTGQLIQGTNNAFDGLNRLQVDGVDYVPLINQVSTTDDGGRTIVTPNVTLSGLSVSREITVPSTGTQDFARTVDIFTNSTGSTITVPVRIVGNLGSDQNTTVFVTSDGNTIIEPTDTWFGTDDADGTGTPAIVHLLRNAAGIQPSNIEVIGDNVVWDYSLTVTAGQTVRLAHFTVLATARADAQTAANVLLGTANALGGQAAAFLTPTELSSFENFKFNQAPTALSLSNASVPENSAANTLVGTFTTTDPDVGDSHTYSLVSGTGDTDNGAFIIDGNSLKVTSGFDFETKNSYSIRVRTTDAAGSTFEQTFAIHVTDVNEAPTAVVLTPSSLNLAENTSTTSSIVVATIAVTDDALGTNALTLTGTDADRFEISGNQLRIRPGVTLDYETKNTYSVTVNVDDSTVGVSPDAMTNLTLNLTDVNEPPSAVSLTPASVSLPENSNTTSAINLATINITDDALGTNTMSLSGADAASFVIFANQLRLRSGVNLDYETKSTYSVRLNVDDVTVGTTPDAFVDFTLTLTDVNEAPTMVMVDPNPATLSENASTVSPIVVGTLTIGDDLIGTNLLSLSGADADRFQIVGSQLRLNAGVNLDYETKSTYTVTVNVDDVTVGSTPDASTIFVLNLIDIDEVLPTVVSVSPSLNSGYFPQAKPPSPFHTANRCKGVARLRILNCVVTVLTESWAIVMIQSVR